MEMDGCREDEGVGGGGGGEGARERDWDTTQHHTTMHSKSIVVDQARRIPLQVSFAYIVGLFCLHCRSLLPTL